MSAPDPRAIDVTIRCGRCGFRSTLRSRRLRGANDLAPFWPRWRFCDDGATCPACAAGVSSYV